MRIYFAPMEGVTDAVYRRVHRRHFDGVDKYFLPFISPSHSMTFNRREKFDMSPEQNASMPAVPQILTNDETYFERLSAILRDLGYREVNLNLGCPSGTVTAKGKGSGLLREPDRLKLFLDGIFAHPILPVSVKTRIGYDDPGEWPALWSLLREYPFLEIILHPRTRQEFYTGTPHREACDLADKPFFYNGDVFTPEDGRQILDAFPRAQGLMLGRGLVANPALAQEMWGGEGLSVEALRSFHDDLYSEYLRWWPESAVVGRMHLMMKYICSCFEDCGRVRRMLRKSVTPAEYWEAAAILFHECRLSSRPAFRLDVLLEKNRKDEGDVSFF